MFKKLRRKKLKTESTQAAENTKIEDDVFTADKVAHGSSSIGASLNRIKSCLNYSLKEKYGIENDEITESLLRIHGLSKKNFEFINNLESLVESKNPEHSDESEDVNVDPNANKSDISVSGLLNENTIPVSKLIGYRYLYRKMVELYGKQRAKFLAGELYDLSLALADASGILKPYCWSVNASRLVIEGRPFGKLYSAPPHRISSYIACLNEQAHQLAAGHLAGAVSIATIFLDCAHLLLANEKKSLYAIRHNKKYRKYVENCLQNFIHSVNHLSRNAVESPFTNVSIFDKPKLLGLLDDENFGWYFDIDKKPADAIFAKSWKDYCADIITEIQNIFLEIMDRGDVLRGGLPIVFPVTTCNISIDENRNLVDNDFVKNICNREIFRYNIFVSSGNKIASCCRLINDEDLFEQGGHVNSLGGGGSVSLGSHRVCTIDLYRIFLECNSFEDYQRRLEERLESCSDILFAHKQLLRDLEKKGLLPFVTNGWIDMNRLFSTIGILGYYEANKHLTEKFGDGVDYLGEILKHIEKFSREKTMNTPDLVLNIEQIPAESMMTRLAKADNLLFGTKEPIFSNQFAPLFEPNHSIWERMDIDGKYGKLLTGGGIVHVSLGERTNPSQSEEIIRYAAKSGCNHFALNPCYSICENNHSTFGKSEVCPICGGKVTDYLTRTIGYFSRVSNWQNNKIQNDFDKRDYKPIEEKK